MLVSPWVTFLSLFASTTLAVPSPQPGFKQTTRDSVTKRLEQRARGIIPRAAASPAFGNVCAVSGPAGQGVVFAKYADNINFLGNGASSFPGNSIEDCTNQCAALLDCAAAYFTGSSCLAWTGYTDLELSVYTVTFKASTCESNAAQYPAIAGAACCNYWAPVL